MSVGGHLEKIGQWGVGDVGTHRVMVCRGYNSRHRGLVLSFSDRTEDATFILCDSHGILSVNLYVSTQIPSKLAMLKHLFLEF